MKKLSLEQMVVVEGGRRLTLKQVCSAHNIAFGVSTLATVAFGLVCPIGFLVVGTVASLACEAA